MEKELISLFSNLIVKESKSKTIDFEKDQIIDKEEQIESKTCHIYDERMIAHISSPECSERIECIWEAIKKYGLHKKSSRLPSKKVVKEDITAVHSKSMVDRIYRREGTNTLNSAILAAGSCVNLVENLIKGDFENGIAIVRPPGHHTKKNDYGGFCYFNNIAIAAQYALDKLGLKKIAIVDFDIHHGNGTQDIFYDNHQVLFISTHKYGSFYPGSGNFDEIGIKKGKGFTVNVPMRGSDYGDKEFELLFSEVVIPVLKEFEPELILVSAGFDAAKDDLLGDFKVSPNGYGTMVYMMKNLGKKIGLVLEGGYNLKVISECASECFRILQGGKPKEIRQEYYIKKINEIISKVKSTHKTYWKCFMDINNE